MRRRRLTVFALGALAPLAMFAACTFPDVGFGPGGSSEAGANDTTSGDGSKPDNDGGGVPDAPLQDATTRTDATQLVDAASCNLATDCDCDHDGYRRDNFGSGACDARAPEAGIDCDDLDPLRHPDSGFVADPPPSGQQPPGDWDCNSKVDKQYSENLSCTAGLNCGAAGFDTTVNCGESAEYYQCSGTLCPKTKLGARRQGCR